jgi:hypothetical protein
MKCQGGKMVTWQNIKLIKCLIDKLTMQHANKMSSWWNGKLTKWQVDKMTKWILRKCQSDNMTHWQKWPSDKMASWQKGKLRKWQVDLNDKSPIKLYVLMNCWTNRVYEWWHQR